MLDWLTAIVGYDASHLPLDQVMCVTPQGEIRWLVEKRLPVVGSYDDRIFISKTPSNRYMIKQKQKLGYSCSEKDNLYISGNLVKFLQGHNCFGAEVKHRHNILIEVIKNYLGEYTPNDINDGYPVIYETRVDIATMVKFPSHSEVHDWIYSKQHTTRSRSGRAAYDYDTTVYWGKHSSLWTLKAYCKACELKKHSPKHINPDDIIKSVDSMLRLELTLRSKELRKLEERNIKLDEKLIWKYAKDRVRGFDVTMTKTDIDYGKLNLSAQVEACLRLWIGGTDTKKIYPKATFYHYRKIILDETGLDIATEYNRRAIEKRKYSLEWVLKNEVKLPKKFPGYIHKPKSENVTI